MLGWLSSYRKQSLRPDLVAGLTTAAVVIPQAMAYAVIAGLPLTIGLYTSLIPLLVYAVMGMSRRLSVTTTSTLAILTAAALHRAAPNGNSAMLISAAATLAMLVGAFLLLASVLRIGAVANFISEPVLVGFKAGIGLVIVVGQIPKLLGVHIVSHHFFPDILSIVEQLPYASLHTMLFALAMLALQLSLQRFFPLLPASLVTVATGIAVSALAGLDRLGIQLVGEVHGGLPSLSLPDFSLLAHLWPAALGIALMSFVESVAAGRAFRGPNERQPDANKELLALGLANMVGGLFHNMPSGGGTSQTAVNSQAGADSQVAALVTAGAVLLVLFLLSPLVQLMPQATLAAVVVASCAGMFHPQEFRNIWQTRALEFSWAAAAMAGVMVLGTLQGIMVAVGLSMLTLIYHANHRPVTVLGRKPGTDVFRALSPQHPGDETFAGLLLIKIEGVIHFANAQRTFDLTWPLVQQYKPRVVALDCSAILDIEYTALKMLTEAELHLTQSGIILWLAALNPEPLDMIQRTPLGKKLADGRLLHNLEQVVERFQAQLDLPAIQPAVS